MRHSSWIAIASIIALSACSSSVKDQDLQLPERHKMMADLQLDFEHNLPALRRVSIPGDSFIAQKTGRPIPKEIADIKLSFDLTGSERPQLDTLLTILEKNYNVPISLYWRSLDDFQDNASTDSGRNRSRSGVGSGGLGGQGQTTGNDGSFTDRLLSAALNAEQGSAPTQPPANSNNGRFQDRARGSLSSRQIPFKVFNGTVAQLLNRLSVSMNIAFWYEDGTLLLSDQNRYSVVLPQLDSLQETVVEEIEGLGADDIVLSKGSGVVSYVASPQENKEIIAPYLSRLINNLAQVTAQISVVSVVITDQNARGFDWSAFNFNFGNLPQQGFSGGGFGGVAGNGTVGTGGQLGGAVGGAAGAAVGAQNAASQSFFGFRDGQQQLGIDNVNLFGATEPLTVNTAIRYLSQFGRARVDQRIELRGFSGEEITVESGDTIPFVTGVSNTPLGGFGGSGGFFNNGSSNGSFNGGFNNGNSFGNNNSINNGNNNSGFSGGFGGNGNAFSSGFQGTAGTSSVQTGINITQTSNYNAQSGLVTIQLDLNINDVVDFVRLEAGNQIGTFVQPRQRGQKFTSTISLPAGQTAVVGGIVRESVETDKAAPYELYKIGSEDRKVEKSLLFVIIRPSVTVYEHEDNPASFQKARLIEAVTTDGKVWRQPKPKADHSKGKKQKTIDAKKQKATTLKKGGESKS